MAKNKQGTMVEVKKPKPTAIPDSNKLKTGYGSVAEMIRDLHVDDPELVERVDSHFTSRRLVKSLAVMRSRAGLTQTDMAARIGCTQSRISKLEHGVDADLKVADLTAYLHHTKHHAKISMVQKSTKLTDEVKFHAFQIKKLLERMVTLAGCDGAMTKCVAHFIQESAMNLDRLIHDAYGKLPMIYDDGDSPIEVDTREVDEEPVADRNQRPLMLRPPKDLQPC